MAIRVHVDAHKCVGRGMCQATGGQVYTVDAATGRNEMGGFEVPLSMRHAALRGAAACPQGAISTEEDPAEPETIALGRVGLWTFALEELPVGELTAAAREIEELGYGTLWFGEAFGREAFTQATMLLGATSKMVVATGIACIYGRDAVTMAQGQRTLAGAFPGRFLLGMGLSSPMGVQRVRNQQFGPPVATMRDYLDGMTEAPLGPSLPVTPRRVIAALGPKMLRLAADKAWGSLSYLVPVDHTVRAREILGSEALLAVEQAVVLDSDVDRARQTAHAHVAAYLRVDHYVKSLISLGFAEDDLRDGGTEAVVDALVAYGDVDAIASRVRKQHEAGADHVCLQVLTADPGRTPMAEWRELAQALL
ncbi:TIGR03620 family F420-dependent LLM class oxidoreductase [Actinocrispum sp. NPDC049592]|uniref:TIGR03620 family F420-dependent LLM class oxidoreductase n=1 Tax=Actinocrispum sp. NPDC049592 TaxID=3154835 RepID=UPI00343C2DBA